MLSLGQLSSGPCLSLKQNYNTWPIVRLGNVGYSSSSVTNKQNHVFRFFELFAKGGTSLRIGAKRKDGWRVWCSNDESRVIVPHQPPPSADELIKDFYRSINAKDTHKLRQLLSQNCEFQDLLFYLPFEGQKEVLDFLKKVMDSMGHNVHLVTESIIENEKHTASVMWHLEWRGKKIPFTNGCCFFECEEHDGNLLIRKLRSVEELPVKPGDLLLKLWKAVTTVCDSFPSTTEGLLTAQKDPHGAHGALRMLIDLIVSIRHGQS